MNKLRKKITMCLGAFVTLILTLVFLVPVILLTLGLCCKTFCNTIADFLHRMLWDIFD